MYKPGTPTHPKGFNFYMDFQTLGRSRESPVPEFHRPSQGVLSDGPSSSSAHSSKLDAIFAKNQPNRLIPSDLRSISAYRNLQQPPSSLNLSGTFGRSVIHRTDAHADTRPENGRSLAPASMASTSSNGSPSTSRLPDRPGNLMGLSQRTIVSGIRNPPSYASLSQRSSMQKVFGQMPVNLHQRSSVVRSPSSSPNRPLRFAPPLPPPPAPKRSESPKHREYKIHSDPMTDRSRTKHDPDMLAKISELAKITRASIPMLPLEDDEERNSLSASRLSGMARSNTLSNERSLMPPPRPRVFSDSGREVNKPVHSNGGHVPSAEAMTTAASSALGIQVEVVSRLVPTPPSPACFQKARFAAIQEPNLSFSSFESALAFLSLDEPPLNPLEIESSKEVLISVFGPKMTLYRCGGCDSSFVFRNIFSDHFYRGIVAYRLRCSHCKDILAFSNVCQVKDHVKSHGYTVKDCKGFILTVAETVDENIKPPSPPAAVVPGGPSSSSPPLPVKSSDTETATPRNTQTNTQSASPSPKLTIGQLMNRGQLIQSTRPQNNPSPSTSQNILQNSLPPQAKPLSSPVTANRLLFNMLESTPKTTPTPPIVQSSSPAESRSTPWPQVQSAQSPRPSVVTSGPLRASAAEALQHLRLRQQHNLALARMQEEYSKAGDLTKTATRPTISVGQILHAEVNNSVGRPVVRADATSQMAQSTQAFLAAASARRAQLAGQKHVCSYCNAPFESPQGLTHHFQRVKDGLKDSAESVTQYECKDCNVICCNSCSFEAHKQLHRLTGNDVSGAYCPECGLKLASREEISAHVERRCVHWCRALFSSFTCGGVNCNFTSSKQDDYFAHLVNEHSGQPDGKNVCPVCRVQITGPRVELMQHLTSIAICRQRVLQQRKYFFAYRCTYCPQSDAPVYETKAAMRDHIVSNHSENPSSGSQVSSNQRELQSILSRPPASSVPQRKRIVTFSEFENSQKRTTAGTASNGSPQNDIRPDGRDVETVLIAGTPHVVQRGVISRPNVIHRGHAVPTDSSPHLQRLHSSKRQADEDSSAQTIPKRPRPTNYACRGCAFECPNEEEFVVHVRNRHPGETPPRLQRSLSDPRYSCKVCESVHGPLFTCDSASVFHDHVRTTHPARETSFQCAECALQLLSLNVLLMHFRVVHDIADPNCFLTTSAFYSGTKFARLVQNNSNS